jgi:hypothetical protein
MTKITDYINRTIGLMIEQFRNLPRFSGLISLIAQQYQELEDMFFDLMKYRGIVYAQGTQLDKIGAVLGLGRTSADDNQYRSDLYFQATINTSKGTPEELILVLQRVTGIAHIDYIEAQPASIFMYLVNPPYLPNNIRINMDKIKPGGVSLNIVLSTDRPFCFSLDGINPYYANGRGFGINSTDINGGQLALPI